MVIVWLIFRRSMTDAQYKYLLSLPLVLHVPSLHSFVLHAGLLPLDPRRSVTSERQPLSHIPHSSTSQDIGVTSAFKARNISVLRTAQEHSLLTDVPQNTEPWNILNVRGVLDSGKVTRSSKEGEPWSDLWNSILERCDGFEDFWSLYNESSGDIDMSKAKKLPCYPSTIVYGHAASRGLDMKRWSKGLDTGCVGAIFVNCLPVSDILIYLGVQPQAYSTRNLFSFTQVR